MGERRAMGAVVGLVAWQALGRAGTLGDSDLWWHLATGDWIRANGIPRSDPFSWTAAGAAWQPNSWLADVGMSLVREWFGLAGISLVRALVVPIVALIIYLWCRQRSVSQAAAVAATAALTLLLSPFIVERPAVIGIAMVGIVMIAADRTSGVRRLVVMALLFVAWANLHGSAVAGMVAVAAAGIGAVLAGESIRTRLAVVGAAVAGSLVNPYGASMYTHALAVRDASVTIDEWQPLALADGRGVAFVAVIVVASLGAVLRRRRSDLVVVVPAAVLTVATVLTVRSAALLIVVAAPLAGAVAERIRNLLATDRYAGRPHPGLIAVGVAALFLTVTNLANLRSIGTVDPAFSPTLVAALPDQCRLFNEYTLGGFVIDQAHPRLLVSQDGRNDLYGAAEIERQTSLVLGADVGPLDGDGIDCVLIERTRPLAMSLDSDPQWSRVADDSMTGVWLRTTP